MKKLLPFLFIIILNLHYSRIISQTSESSKIKNLNALCQYLKKNNMFNGNILVMEKDQPLCKCSIGFANLETRQPLTLNSVFELASVSKQFTAVGILVLVDEGKICVDQLIEFILPDFPYGTFLSATC